MQRWMVSLAVACLPAAAMAQTFLPDFVGEQVAAGLTRPTAMEFAPDGRVFICQQNGALRVVKNGALLADPFLTLPVDSSGERGLIGVTFDPNFSSNGHLYAHYTVISGTQRFNRISRFTASGDTVVPGSELVLMNLDALSGATNHNGGALHFGADGMLYVAVGDNANPANAQTLGNRLGKILRLAPDGSIPADNPFFNTATGDNRAIWALGLRNPFTFGVHPTNGTIYLNDVGQDTWEEINVGAAGANYGWGTNGGANEGPFDASAFPGLTPPLVAYQHGAGTERGFAIAGGAFYRPGQVAFPTSYLDDYFYADYINGWIRAANGATSETSLFASDLGRITDLKVGLDGNLYYLGFSGTAGAASLQRIRYTAATIAPEPTSLALLGGAGIGWLVRRRRQKTP